MIQVSFFQVFGLFFIFEKCLLSSACFGGKIREVRTV